ncbi:hypothetical protein [Clostridium perfringens]|uniref:hypothetical protein n=1 Tax=Clostridium perfringens TaxID=1502 RepID=UPI000D70D3F8|nr:hypothetical protein [Clostridium perfringens]PWX20908.1 hypothetical protein CYK64_09390 [Clostridium perfringens]TPG00093.1 hypothetical protein CBI46_10010 [Clostridium perfringens A]
MELVNFNSEDFKGFPEGEEILVDTGIILAYLNEYDTWHNTVKNLFENHILNNDKTIFLFVNPCIINEVTFLKDKPIVSYQKKTGNRVDITEIQRVSKAVLQSLNIMVDNEILEIIDGDKESVKKQIELSDFLGSADAVNASIANAYGINFLTIDTRLANNMKIKEEKLTDVKIIYHTTAEYKTY